jgi:glycosyltransferase involved in cell wall biosynthesis
MKFSIITVVKNSENLIEKTIKSIINQTYKNFEFIIIDGKSSDNTMKVVNDYKKFIHQLVSERDKGIYFAMNKGLSLSNGEIIVFVNAGDTLEKKALEIIQKYFKNNPDIDFVFGTVEREYLNETIIKQGFDQKKIRYNFDFATCHSTGFFIRKKSQNILGLYDENFLCSSDYDLFYRMIVEKKMNGMSTGTDELIGRVSSGGYSSKFGFFNHTLEENKIRIKHKQNKLLIMIISINKIIKRLFYLIKLRINKFF